MEERRKKNDDDQTMMVYQSRSSTPALQRFWWARLHFLHLQEVKRPKLLMVRLLPLSCPSCWRRWCWRPILLDHPGLVIVVLLPPLHLQEVKSYSLSEATVYINLHCHNTYNVPDHSADVAAAWGCTCDSLKLLYMKTVCTIKNRNQGCTYIFLF